MTRRRNCHDWVVFLLLAGLCAGCAAPGSPSTTGKAPGAYRPPTLVASVTALSPASLPPLRLTPTALCTAQLTFQKDLTIPDDTEVAPGASLVKQWVVRNSGTCNWDNRYRIRQIGGSEMGVAKELALYPARSGSEATLQIEFIAPTPPGTYRSAWQAYTPIGEAFGDPFFIEIVVR